MNGDKADNIPGVEGVGPKTAAKLLKEYGDIEGILDVSDKMAESTKKKMWKRIASGKRDLIDSRNLVQLVVDADIKRASHEDLITIKKRTAK